MAWALLYYIVQGFDPLRSEYCQWFKPIFFDILEKCVYQNAFMKKNNSSILLSIIILLLFSLNTFGQEFGNFKNIENFFELSKKQIDSTLIVHGYKFKSKETKSGLITYEKINTLGKLYVNLKYKDGNLTNFGWDDFITRASFIIGDIGNNKTYKVDENKTNDELGIFYLTSPKLNVIIFKTISNTENGKIAFSLLRG